MYRFSWFIVVDCLLCPQDVRWKQSRDKVKITTAEDPASAYPSLKHATQLLVPCSVSRINYRCLSLHCKTWQRLTCGNLGSQEGFKTIKTAVGESIWGGSQRGALTASRGRSERLVRLWGCRAGSAGHMGQRRPGLGSGQAAGRAASRPAVPWAPCSSSDVEMGLVKPEDTTGNIR